MAAEKTEALLVTKRKKFVYPTLKIGDTVIDWKKEIKYLGIYLASNLSFDSHLSKVADKASRTCACLSRLMPNRDGPVSSKQRLLASVIHSQILYAAPIWPGKSGNCAAMRKLASVQRRAALRVTSAYRTVSHGAIMVIAGMPPIDLLARQRQEVYEELRHARSGLSEKQFREKKS